jgi:osmoprotectant transport system permease protein
VIALGAGELVDVGWIVRNLDDIWTATRLHALFTVVPVLLGLAIAFPVSLAAVRFPRLYGPILGVAGLLYTIPAIALFVLLLPFLGLSEWPVLVALTIYTLLILIRNTVEGLRGVSRDVLEAADAMGYRPTARLLRVELPVATPVIIAGLRIATVSTIGLVAVGALLGQERGGYGRFFIDGYQRGFFTPQLVGILGCLLLAVVFDLLLVTVQRGLTPWTRRTG